MFMVVPKKSLHHLSRKDSKPTDLMYKGVSADFSDVSYLYG
jgi:hypothetical protein